MIQPFYTSIQNTLPQRQVKIVLRKQDVKISFLLARPVGGKYKIEYIVTIIPSVREKNPSVLLNPLTVDMNSLKQAIIQNLDSYDRGYLEIGEFDTAKAIFYVSERYYADMFRSITVSTTFSSFRRDFKFGKRLLRVIAYDPIHSFDDFLLKKFLEYMKKNHKDALWFKLLLPEQMRKRYRGRTRILFDWNYDPTLHKITATLKTIYIIAIIYATGSMLKKMNNNATLSYSDQKLFSDKVKGNLKKFDSKKFEKYVRRRGFI